VWEKMVCEKVQDFFLISVHWDCHMKGNQEGNGGPCCGHTRSTLSRKKFKAEGKRTKNPKAGGKTTKKYDSYPRQEAKPLQNHQ
jgi:hypothetical protein